MDRAILHCDMNNFFASVECLLDENLRGKPVAVCGDVTERHGIVMARNTEAKKCGVSAGEPIWQAKNKCKNLVTVTTPHYDEYEKYSRLARNIYRKYTDYVEPFGMDECWLDVTNSQLLFGKPKKIADEIRERIKRELGLTISVGVSFTKSFAKLGSDYKKPDATTVISRENFKEIVWPLPASDLLGVGRKTSILLEKHYISTIGDIANEKMEHLEYLLGKNGIYLYNCANGLDDSEVQKYEELDEVKSISHGITTIEDLNTKEEVWRVMLELTQEIALKLRQKKLRAQGVSVSIRDSELFWVQFRKKLDISEQSAINIATFAFKLFNERYEWEKPIRTVSIAAINLIEEGTPEQVNLFDDMVKKGKIEKLEKCVEDLNEKYGEEVIKNAGLYDNDNLPGSRRRIKYAKKS